MLLGAAVDMDYHELIITFSMILSSASVNLFAKDVAELLVLRLPIYLRRTHSSKVVVIVWIFTQNFKHC